MEKGAISDDVVRFINEKIDSVPQLEALLLLFESAPKGWTALEVSARVYVPEERARDLLQELALRQLVVRETETGEQYRYSAGWDATGNTMQKVAAAYRRRLVSVATLIHTKASPAVRDFARAFQFKKDK